MLAIVGVLSDDTDPMVSVMKLDKAPQESYADIGGLDAQIQEIKVGFNTGLVQSCSILLNSPIFVYITFTLKVIPEFRPVDLIRIEDKKDEKIDLRIKRELN